MLQVQPVLLCIHLGISALFLLLGLPLRRGKGAFLIAGYNTASPQEKARIDEKALCRFMGKVMFLLAACFAVIALSDVFATPLFLVLGLLGVFAAGLFAVFYSNTKNRFRKE